MARRSICIADSGRSVSARMSKVNGTSPLNAMDNHSDRVSPRIPFAILNKTIILTGLFGFTCEVLANTTREFVSIHRGAY